MEQDVTTFFGAIADDFTGATDLAALLARSGAKVSLRLGVPSEPPRATAPIEIIALKIRTAPVADAIAEALAALAWLRRAGAQRFFWKYCSTFDSTPQGNIGPVAEALMAKLGVAQTIYCPAFPENGRAIFMGNLYVGEQPLAESSMKDHPLTPMRDSNLMRLLAPQVTKPVGLVNRLAVARGPQAISGQLDALKTKDIAHVIVDAVANEDLGLIAEAASTMTLLTGGSALAMPLPEVWRGQGHLTLDGRSAHAIAPEGRSLVLSGSCSAMTNRQVAHYLKTGQPGLRLDPLALAADGVQPILNWLSQQQPQSAPLIYATAASEEVRAVQSQLGAERAGSLVEQGLAKAAVAAQGMGFRRFVIAGGETSGAVSKALGVVQLDIGREIAPGVPWCIATSDGDTIAIALKSGNFGAETFFEDALGMLDR
jgi:3-dehydrotetronate 4-kinase